jgi:aspartyl-tRNA(Asn)/glutamyl-tRNA(Gln) amidotransferase subunit B
MQMGNKSTRGWDDERQMTVLQREKEEAHDYRYFPEPDLVPVEVDQKWLGAIRGRLCELPVKRQMRYVSEYGLSDYDAGVLTAERQTAEFFERAVAAGGDAKRVCNLLTQKGLKLANERGCGVHELGVEAEAVAELARMVESGQVSASASDTILEHMVESGTSAAALAEELNLVQKSDAGELEGIVDAVLAENAAAVEDVRSGGKKCKKARGFLLGQVMQKTKGQANPKVVGDILDKKLG